MEKEEVDALSDAELYATARDIARHYGGESAARRVMAMPLEQVRNFLIMNGG